MLLADTLLFLELKKLFSDNSDLQHQPWNTATGISVH